MTDRNARDSIAELHERLFELFREQPGCQYDENNNPTIAIQEVLPVFHTFLGEFGMPALTTEQIEEVHRFADAAPQLRLTPEVLFQTLLHVTGKNADHFEAAHSPPRSPARQPPKDSSPAEWYGDEDDEDLAPQQRGRDHSRDSNHSDSRSSSRDSVVTSYQRNNGDGSHPPSAFDGKNRRRTKPIDPPSSWNQRRPVPASKRRRSDAHSQAGSDTESNPPHSGRRSRDPSNPVSPKDSHAELPSTRSRPSSRQGSRPILIHGRHQSLDSHHYGSPPDRATIDESSLFSSSRASASASMGMSHSFSPDDNNAKLLWPRQRSAPNRDPDSDDAEDNEDDAHIVPERLSVASLASLTDPDERLAALQKHLNETQRRNAESEKHLQDDLAAREQEIVDLQTKLDRRSEDLSIKTREEKELRVKERNHITAINNLEAEVNKLQRALEGVRSSYETLKKQYADQIAESDKYRLQLRLSDNELREVEARELSHVYELEKAARDREILENQIKLLEESLQLARVAEDELDTQKQDNIMLKETIDRLRFELDELRASHALELASLSGSSAPNSRPPTLSRSLGSEFQRGMLRQTTIREGAGQEDRNGVDTEDDAGEEIYHTTIIKKRVPGRGKKGDIVQQTSLLDYVDAMTQYDSEEFHSDAFAQTDPSEKELRVSAEVQTDPEEDKSRRKSDLSEEEERLAASTSTAYHRLFHQSLHPWDEPPSYALSELEQSTTREDRAALEVLRKWHGVKVLGPLPKGISQDTVEDWAALKREMGVECAVIDKIIEQSTKHGRLSRRDYARRYVEGSKRKFYNIYNTYVLGGDASGSAGRPGGPGGRSADSMGNVIYAVGFAALGACSAVALMRLGNGAMTDRLVAPGSPIYADRAFWTSANAMVGMVGEGFGGGAPPTSVTAVWHVLERLVHGATRVVTRT